MARFTVLLHPADDGGYVAEVPGLHVTTQGDTVEQALMMAKDAAVGVIESMVAQRDVIVPELVPPIIASIEVDVPAAIDAYAPEGEAAPVAEHTS